MLLRPSGGGESPRKTRKVPKKADASQTSDSAKPRWSQPPEDSGDHFMDSLGIQRDQKKQKALQDKIKTLKPRDRKESVSMPKVSKAELPEGWLT